MSYLAKVWRYQDEAGRDSSSTCGEAHVVHAKARETVRAADLELVRLPSRGEMRSTSYRLWRKSLKPYKLYQNVILKLEPGEL